MRRLLEGRLRRRRRDEAVRFDQLAALLAGHLQDVARPRVAVLRPTPAALLDAVRRAVPEAELVEAPVDDGERHLLLARRGPFDAVLDRPVPAGDEAANRGRRRRFQSTFFHLRPGGLYVVPGGATELGPEAGALGKLLRKAETAPDEAFGRLNHSVPLHVRLALKNHVTARAEGPDLLLTHDLADVRIKFREDEFNLLLEQVDTPHRVLKVFPAQKPPAPPATREGPDPRIPPIDRPITRATISLREYRDVVMAPKQLLVDGRFLLPDTYRHNQWKKLQHTQLADAAPRFAIVRHPLPADPERLDGTYVHLDNEFRGHFGHLMTESLSRVWSWPEALAIDPDVKALIGANHKRPRPNEYEYLLYEAAGIPRERIVVVEHPVRVERLISGTPMFSHPQYVHPRIVETWLRVGDALAAQAEPREWPQRFFASRRTTKRACVNGAEVEKQFVERGFEILYPEDYTLGEQVQLFRNAEVIAGYAGSGLFQIAFVPDPKRVIMIGAESYRPRNEYLMAAVHGHRIDSVICRSEGRSIQSSYHYDDEREGPFLREILQDLGD